MFHPDGHTFAGFSEPVAEPDGPYAHLAAALTGRVLARCSAALWRHDSFEHLDVLGLALRFRRGPGAPLDHEPAEGDTDLLTATIRSPLTMLLSPLFTDATDFAGNRYWAVSPFTFGELRFELRLVPIAPHQPTGANRTERLARAVSEGRAGWVLEGRATLHLEWHPIVRVELVSAADIDQAALRFDPFRGVLNPVGLVHAIRRAAYAASQRAHPGNEVTAEARSHPRSRPSTSRAARP
ncbi:MAG: hypothetical protein H0V17_14465 [Deltaproteobacteria bacterium]|nr:hypothetical protein [Deltaproteobacteria bacterium]